MMRKEIRKRITSKGVFNWNASIQESKAFDSQIVINQVEMLQFPIEKFSSCWSLY